MEYLKTILKIVRAWSALPFLFLGFSFYWIAEKISGDIYTYNGATVSRATRKHLEQQGFVRKGFRTPPRR